LLETHGWMRKIFSEPADPYINRSVSRSAFHCTSYFLQQSSFRLFIARSLLSPSKRWYSCVSTARLHALRFTTSCGLDKAKFVTTADAADGYWLAPLDKTTSYSLTAFDSPLGRLEWLCLPMGLQPSAGWFQKFLEDALRRHNLLYTGEFNKGRDAETGKLQNFVSTYQDDLIYWSETEEEHKEMTHLLLTALSTEKLHLNPSKLNLACKYTRYLGCIVGNGKLSMDPRKVSAVNDLVVEKNAGDIRKFVGMAQFYRRWIAGFSTMVAPLTDMLKKSVDVEATWGDAQDGAISKIKQSLTSYPCLRQWDPSRPPIGLVDARHTTASILENCDHICHRLSVNIIRLNPGAY
jgi:hypothetical protein